MLMPQMTVSPIFLLSLCRVKRAALKIIECASPSPPLPPPCCSKQGVEKKARKEREKPHKKGKRKTKEDPPERKEGKERRREEGGLVGLERDLQFGETTENGVETRGFRVCLLKSLYYFSCLLTKILYVPWSFLSNKKKKTLFMFYGDS